MNQDHTAHIAVDPKELHTVRDWVRFYVSEMRRGQVFFGHGSSNAFDEAVYMVQSALSLPVGDVGPFWDARVTAHETNRLIRFITQRVVDRKPASYITGEAWLQGHAFKVDERVIIPRSFIAELLADQLTPWVNAPEMPFEILDMCTGSGCLAILAAYVFENAQVDAVDLSTEALSIARENIQLHDMKQRVHAIESDLFSNLNGKQYDFILTNPPYVNEASMKKLPPEYLHEPRMALAGGDSVMDLIQDILEQAPKHLKDGGFLVVELGNEKLHFEAAFPHLNPIWLETSAGVQQVFLLNKEHLV